MKLFIIYAGTITKVRDADGVFKDFRTTKDNEFTETVVDPLRAANIARRRASNCPQAGDEDVPAWAMGYATNFNYVFEQNGYHLIVPYGQVKILA